MELFVISTSNCFFITIEEFVKSTLEILLFGNFVYRLLSEEVWNWDVSILKLDGFITLVGNPPSQIPVTVVTPEIVKEFCDTLSTLA